MLTIPKPALQQPDTNRTPLKGDAAAPVPRAAQSRIDQHVLITEGQVAWATAAARKHHVDFVHHPWLATPWHWLVLRIGTEHHAAHQYPPRRLSYFEQAAMAREMDRL